MEFIYSLIYLMVCIISAGILQTDSATILLLPNPFPSHWSWMVLMGAELKKKNHEVYAVVRNSPDMTGDFLREGINILTYDIPVTDNKTMADKLEGSILRLFENGPPTLLDKLTQNYDLMQIIAQEGDYLVQDATLKANLRTLNFDVAVVDGTPNAMYLLIVPYALNIPYISCSMSIDGQHMGLPALPSFHPLTIVPLDDKMNFLQRTFNTAVYLLEIPFAKYFFPGTFRNWIKQYNSSLEDKPLDVLLRNSNMWLYHQMIPFEYPRATLPHVVFTGPWNIKPASALLPDLKAWMDEGEQEGVIVFSLGSSTSHLQPWIMHKLFSGFAKTGLRVIGRYSGPITNYTLYKSKLMPWIPQNDLLGHPATKIFVSHCGNNGLHEALYHGVPIIGFPLFGDHFYNCHRVPYKGFGRVLDIGTFTAEDLAEAVRDVLTDGTYRRNVQHASAVMKRDPQLPLQKATYWVEHFIDLGADHLRSPSLEFNWFIYHSVDSLLVIGIFVTFLTFVSYKIMGILLERILELWHRIVGASAKRMKLE